MTREQLAGAVARGWCVPNNAHKVMDVDLAYAIVDEVQAEVERTQRALPGLATTGELIDELRARAEIGGYSREKVYYGPTDTEVALISRDFETCGPDCGCDTRVDVSLPGDER